MERNGIDKWKSNTITKWLSEKYRVCLVQRGFGVGFVGEKFTVLEKYFYKKKMGVSWKK